MLFPTTLVGSCPQPDSNRFATALEGVDIDNPGTALDRSGHPNPVPRIVGPVCRTCGYAAGTSAMLAAGT
jgi:5-methyltetrahydropteroyltriglutamate--homocysteine methyltransferase